jgi:hypothetical protein
LPRPLVVPAEAVVSPAASKAAPREATVMLGLAAAGVGMKRNTHGGWAQLSGLAGAVAEEQSTTVGLLGMDNGMLVLELFGLEAGEAPPPVRPSQAPADFQLARVLYMLRQTVGIWLVAAPDPESAAFRGVARAISHWLLACPTDNDGLVAAYQHLKRACVFSSRSNPGEAPTAYLISDDPAQASLVHKRLRTAAHEFLKTDLPLGGVIPLAVMQVGVDDQAENHAGGVRLMTLPVQEGAAAAIWSAILDELCPPAQMEEGEQASARSSPGEVRSPKAAAPAAAPRTATTPPARPVPAAATPPVDIETALEQMESSADDLARSSAAATHAMLDHLAQVLDPEEREALSAGFDEDEENEEPAARFAEPAMQAEPRKAERPTATPYDIRTQVHRPAPPAAARATGGAPVKPTSVTAAAPSSERAPEQAGVTLRAFDLADPHDADRTSQWQSVERSIRDLVPESILLEARPPMSWASESCIAIDPDGILHIWTLYKDGATWYALREWASEHRNLLALTRRDLVLSRDADVVVHIVLPLEAHVPVKGAAGTKAESVEKVPSVINTILRTPAKNIHIYRLRVLQWNARRGLIVVPIS